MALKRFSESVEFFPSAEEGNAVDMKIDVVPFLHRPKDSLDADTDYSDDSLVNTDGKITLENLAKAIKSNQTLATVSDVETRHPGESHLTTPSAHVYQRTRAR